MPRNQLLFMCQPDNARRLPVFAGHGIRDSRGDFRACVFRRCSLRLLFAGRRRDPARLFPLKYHAHLALVPVVSHRRINQDDQHHHDKCDPEYHCFLHASVTCHERTAGVSSEEVAHPPEFLIALLHQFFT